MSTTFRLLVEGLDAERGGRRVLAGIGFRLEPGEGLLLTGPNGAGKTTLLRTLAGLIRPASGRILLQPASSPGGAPTDDDAPVATLTHFIGHLNGLKASFTVRENLAFFAGYLAPAGDGDRARRVARIDAALERLNLSSLAEIPAGYLSAGQKRRLAIARLAAAARPLWLLDEPSVSLDEASRNILAGLVDQHLADGGIAIAATHLPLGMAITRELRLARPGPAVVGAARDASGDAPGGAS